MQKSHFHQCLLGALLVGIVLIVRNVDAVWSISVDLAHHYALAFRIAENWQLIPNDPTLGEMNYYPRLAHTVSAIVGTLFGSVFMGMQLVALASLVLVWAACVAILYTLPRHLAVLSAGMLAVLVGINHRFFGFDLHGAEIVGHFFFSQLLAQGLCLMALALAIHATGRRSPLYVYGLLLFANFVLVRVHLLGALELLGVLVGVVVLDNSLFQGPRRERLRFAGLSLGLLVAAFAIVLLSPDFAAMSKISENNGRLPLRHVDSMFGMMLLAVAGLVCAAVLLFYWLREGRRLAVFKFMGLYGATVSALCLLQSVLLRYGMGSEYAIKKYAFGISSFVLIALALVAGVLLARIWNARRGSASAPSSVPAPVCALVAVVALVVSFTCSVRPLKQMDASDIVGFERALITLRDTTLQQPVPGKTDLVIDLDGQPSIISYMFSIALFHAPRAVAGVDLLVGYKLGPLDQYRTVISSRTTSRYVGRGCGISPHGALLAIDGACLKQAVIAASVCRQRLDFSARGDLEVGMLTGFSVPEQEGRWTSEKKATVTCTVDKPFHTAHLSMAPFLGGGHPRQRVAVTVNGSAPVHHEFTAASSGTSIAIPLPPATAGQQLSFTIDLPDAVSPLQLGLGDDGRMLGVTVQHLNFE